MTWHGKRGSVAIFCAQFSEVGVSVFHILVLCVCSGFSKLVPCNIEARKKSRLVHMSKRNGVQAYVETKKALRALQAAKRSRLDTCTTTQFSFRVSSVAGKRDTSSNQKYLVQACELRKRRIVCVVEAYGVYQGGNRLIPFAPVMLQVFTVQVPSQLQVVYT